MPQDNIAKEDIYVDSNGKVVPFGPEAAVKIASKGSVIPDKVARRYGLNGAPKADEPKSKTLTSESIENRDNRVVKRYGKK